MTKPTKRNLFTMIGPGILVAATGVGAGDLAAGAISGSKIGVAVLWAVLVGAAFKFVLNEGLARWQLATGSTLLEGTVKRLGKLAGWLFLPYLLVWSFLVAMALMAACGVTAHAIFQIFDNATHDKILYGIIHSVVAVVLIAVGGYRLFEKLMSVCIAVMFLIVVTTAIALQPNWGDVFRGIILPTIPAEAGADGLNWTVGLIGGVGGTVTVLCYGYWIREEGRSGPAELNSCRLDLAVGYTMTALFGLAMVIIGSHVVVEGKGATLLVDLANELENALGPVAKWAFLIGGWSAVFSSMLGVWQSVPYLFADLCDLLIGRVDRDPDQPPAFDLKSPYYTGYLLAIASVPVIGLIWFNFQDAMRINAIFGAAFVPMLAIVLLLLCTRAKFMTAKLTNRWWTSAVLVGMLVFFGFILWQKLQTMIWPT